MTLQKFELAALAALKKKGGKNDERGTSLGKGNPRAERNLSPKDTQQVGYK